jgi:hypothetical protein
VYPQLIVRIGVGLDRLSRPLPLSDDHDQGGESRQVRFIDRGSNRHGMWHSDLIERAWVKSPGLPIGTDRTRPGAAPAPSMTGATANLLAAGRDDQCPTTGMRIGPGQRLADAYLEANLPVVRRRLYQGGIRLATLLNDVWPAD